MREIANPGLIHLKGVLFLALGLLASGLVVIETPTVRTALLLAVCIWAFCRFYYYSFYVIERYVDPSFRFSGLLSLTQYLYRHILSARDRLRDGDR